MPINSTIPSEKVDALLSKIKALMRVYGIDQSTTDNTKLVVIHPETWALSLRVPYKAVRAAEARRVLGQILYKDCGVDRGRCDYFGRQRDKESYEWYFSHPNLPQEIAERIDAEAEAEVECEPFMGLPIPSGNVSNTDTVFLSLKDEFFKQIQSGMKTVEYRNLNQYYCDKFFSPGVKKQFVKLNRGYLSGAENQMVFEIADIVFIGQNGDECPCVDRDGNPITDLSQIPQNFKPKAYGIKLGKRVA